MDEWEGVSRTRPAGAKPKGREKTWAVPKYLHGSP